MTTISRRDFVLSSAAFAGLAASGLLLPRRAWARAGLLADPTFFKWTEVAPGFHVALNKTDDFALVGGNTTLLMKQGEGVMIDTKQTVLGPGLLREAAAISGAITTVLNTHHHMDHTGGNAAFSEAGAKLYAHPRCRERVEKMTSMYTAGLDQKITALEKSGVDGAAAATADAKAFKDKLSKLKPDAFTPEGTLEGGKPLDLAGHKIEVHHVGPGHTDNDVFFFFPKENVLVAGDLIFSGLHAYYDSSGGANSTGWVRSLGRVIQLCNEKTVVIPGHGVVGDVEIAKKQIKYFEDVQAAVAKAIKEGKSKQDVQAMTLPQYSEYGLKQAQQLVMAGVYDEMMKEKGGNGGEKEEKK
jgi:glyoxylase-like metal-dependent hydrolase (beta-lactamase superfamily II)